MASTGSDRGLVPVFAEPSSDDDSPRGRSEVTTAWLTRSSRDIAQESRQLLNSWVSKLDVDDDLVDVVARLRSGDDGQFRSAFFELYLHRSFLASGWDVEVHAKQANGHKPDFVVTTPTGRVVVEATSTNPSGITSNRRRGVRVQTPAYSLHEEFGFTAAQQKRHDVLLDHIDKMRSPNFSLGVTSFAVGPNQLSARKVIRDLTKWLASFDPDDGHPDDVYLLDEDGWRLEFDAYATSPEHRGKAGRTIGTSMGGEADEINDDEALWRSLDAKAGVYGDLGLPYVIAVNEHSWETQESAEWHRTSALYGSSGVVAQGPMVGRPVRQPDGFWRGPTWRNQDVSAVLLTTDLSPWNVARNDVELWVNPHASRPTDLRQPYWRVRRVDETGGAGRAVVDEPTVTSEQFWR